MSIHLRHLVDLVLLLSVVAALSLPPSTAAIVGGWKPIENPKDPHVIDVGKFAVSEYNKKFGAKLKFESVIKGETQVVAGTNYKLVVAANGDSGNKQYEAIVWEKPWEHFMQLTSFKPISQA